jgi:hypothetical protein
MFCETDGSLDELIKDELGRKLFQEHIKATQTTNGRAQELNDALMLYMILECLPQCNKPEQMQTMLRCTFNAYFRNRHKLPSLAAKSELIRSQLPAMLEQLNYDFDLYERAKEELREHLLSSVYESFRSSQLFKTSAKIMQTFRSKDSDYLFACIMNQSGGASDAAKTFLTPSQTPRSKEAQRR